MTRPRTSGTYVPPPGRGGCSTGKVRFASRKQARASRRRIPTGDALSVYRCPECDWFHIGHRPERIRNGEVDKVAWLNAKGNR